MVTTMSFVNSFRSNRLPTEDLCIESYTIAPCGTIWGAALNGSTAHCGPVVSGLPISQHRYALSVLLLLCCLFWLLGSYRVLFRGPLEGVQCVG